MAAALAAVLAALVFGSSVSHVIGDPAVAGWDWDVTVGNPHSDDVSEQAVPRLRADGFVSGFTVTAMGATALDGRDDVTIVGLQTVTGRVVPPVLAGRLPRAPRRDRARRPGPADARQGHRGHRGGRADRMAR